MATSLDTNAPLDTPVSRKRKQEFGADAKPGVSNLAVWSDYVYSTPSSPVTAVPPASDGLLLDTHMSSHAMDPYAAISGDTLFSAYDQDLSAALHAQHADLSRPAVASGVSSRRHSVAVPELGYHTLESGKHAFDMRHLDADLQQLLGMPATTWSPSTSSNSSHATLTYSESLLERRASAAPSFASHAANRRRTMSLCLETALPVDGASTGADTGTPATPSLFSPSFLDALNADEEKPQSFLLTDMAQVHQDNTNTNTTFPSSTAPNSTAMITSGQDNIALVGGYLHDFQSNDFMGMSPSPTASSTDYLLQHHHHHHPSAASVAAHTAVTTIAPSVIANPDFQTLNHWMLENTAPPAQPTTPTFGATRRTSTGSVMHNHPTSSAHQSPARYSPPTSPANTAQSSSSASPSPPTTPLKPVANAYEFTSYASHHPHHHPAIPEEDEDLEDGKPTLTPPATDLTWSDATRRARTSKSGLVTARMLQGAQSAAALKPHIRRYLLHPDPASAGERTLMFLTSKVAQKSYGTEKRFLCPPPTTIMMDASWWTTENQDKSGASMDAAAHRTTGTLAGPKLTIHISGETTPGQTGALEWYTANDTLFDGSAAGASHAMASGNLSLTGKCVSKQLHINDADEKRKRVEVLAKIQLANGVPLGTFASKGIKVISKPSKKRQSVKNMDLCIHHGTTISLFNRIRSQTVSTKYLGVSCHGPQSNANASGTSNSNNGTCFVARTGSWDPFVIWIVDTTRAPDITAMPQTQHPTHPHYPPPPAIALQAEPSQQPLAIHYNQAVVLQCVTTGLVSPVMVIRKVDKGSMVLGGNRMDDLSGTTGGECGDEALGDPVSQLHKVAFQIVQDPSIAQSNKTSYRRQHHHPLHGVSTPSPTASEWTLPQACQPVTYLACLNDVVGMHKTTTPRTMISSRPPSGIAPLPNAMADMDNLLSGSWHDTSMHTLTANPHDLVSSVVSQEGGKVVRKRRVSCDVKAVSLPNKLQQASLARRRVNSLNDVPVPTGRRASTIGTLGAGLDGSAHRRGSVDSHGSSNGNSIMDGACWTEDVSDAAVWTIVGTDCATYTFWMPPALDNAAFNNPFTATGPSQDPILHAPITPFPVVNQLATSGHHPSNSNSNSNNSNSSMDPCLLTLTGENLSRDLAVWFGDVKALRTDYKSRESISCVMPKLHDLLNSPTLVLDEQSQRRKLPLLLVRGDGVVYRTGQFYVF